MPLIIDDMFDFLLYEKGEDITYNGLPARVLLIDAATEIQYEDDKEIITDFPIKTGDMLQYDDCNWFIIGQVSKHESLITYRSRITKVEQSFKIYIDNLLKTIPAIFQPVTQSVEVSGAINTWTGNLKVLVQDNELTKNINLNAEFIKMGAKWKVDGFTTEHLGLRTLYCEKIAFDTSIDDIENEIANKGSYVYAISINEGDTLSQTVNTEGDLTYNLTFNGQTSTLPVEWISSDSSVANIDISGHYKLLQVGNVTFTVRMIDDNTVCDSIAVSIISVPVEVKELVIDPMATSILQADTQSYNTYLTVNGIKQDNTVTVVASGIPSNYYTLTITSPTSFTVENLQRYTANPLHVVCSVEDVSKSIDIQLLGIEYFVVSATLVLSF